MHLRKPRKHKETVPFTQWLIVHPFSKERFLFIFPGERSLGSLF